MEERIEITATRQNGETYNCTAPRKMWMCLADRVHFERRFGVPAIAYEAHRRAGTLPDEWPLFFAWRCLVRGVPELAEVGFDVFVEDALELDLNDPDAPDTEASEGAGTQIQPEEAEPDPTPREPAPLP